MNNMKVIVSFLHCGKNVISLIMYKTSVVDERTHVCFDSNSISSPIMSERFLLIIFVIAF